MSKSNKNVLFKIEELWNQFELSQKKDKKLIANEFDIVKKIQPNIISEMMIVLIDKDIEIYAKELTSLTFYSFWNIIKNIDKVKKCKIYMEVFDKNYNNNISYLSLFKDSESNKNDMENFLTDSLDGYRQKEMIGYLVMIVQCLLEYTKMDGNHIAKVFASIKSLFDTFDQLLNDELKLGIDYLEE
ncbi:MAG: hypothetical protein H6611_10220 [Ignavibacteriales bacterium]|nr:hypothetical protein [Ignavibacteriales bacterium]